MPTDMYVSLPLQTLERQNLYISRWNICQFSLLNCDQKSHLNKYRKTWLNPDLSDEITYGSSIGNRYYFVLILRLTQGLISYLHFSKILELNSFFLIIFYFAFYPFFRQSR